MTIKKNFFVSLGITLWIMTVMFAILPSWPHLYYRLMPQASDALASTLASTVSTSPVPLVKGGSGFAEGDLAKPIQPPTPVIPDLIGNPSGNLPTPTPTTVIPAEAGIHPIAPNSLPLPEVDPSLPIENGLIIEKIGVRGQIHEGEDWQKILRTGIWRVPNFGSPTDTTAMPTILAAHRWGYLDWSSAFRKLNSFYNLPQVKVGDKVKVVWDQRPFEYEVYAIDTGTIITDYTAGLILYTCQLWNSPVRFFVYANRTN